MKSYTWQSSSLCALIVENYSVLAVHNIYVYVLAWIEKICNFFTYIKQNNFGKTLHNNIRSFMIPVAVYIVPITEYVICTYVDWSIIDPTLGNLHVIGDKG